MRELIKLAKYSKGLFTQLGQGTFTIHEIVFSTPITFKIRDSKEEEIRGNFYKEELQKAKPPSFYNIGEVLKRKNEKRQAIFGEVDRLRI